MGETGRHRRKCMLAGCLIAILTTASPGDTDKKELLSQVAEAQRKIQSIHVTFCNRVRAENYTDVNMWEWAMKGEKRYRKKRYGADIDTPEGKEPRWGKCMWDGRLLRHYDSISDNGGIYTSYSPYGRGANTYNPYCRHFGTLMGVTLLSLTENLSADDWQILHGETRRIVVLTTDDVDMTNGHVVHEWHIDREHGGMICRYKVHLKTAAGLETVSDMRVLEWRNMGNDIWLPSKSTTSQTLPKVWANHPNKPPHLPQENTLTLVDAEVNQASIDRFFADFEWPRGCQYYDERLDATVIPHASAENMEAAVNRAAAQAIDDIESTLPVAAQGEGTPAADSQGPVAHRTGAPGQHVARSGRGTGWSWIIYIGIGVGLALVAAVLLLKRRGRRGDVRA